MYTALGSFLYWQGSNFECLFKSYQRANVSPSPIWAHCDWIRLVTFPFCPYISLAEQPNAGGDSGNCGGGHQMQSEVPSRRGGHGCRGGRGGGRGSLPPRTQEGGGPIVFHNVIVTIYLGIWVSDHFTKRHSSKYHSSLLILINSVFVIWKKLSCRTPNSGAKLSTGV